jgi:hypothetical protein
LRRILFFPVLWLVIDGCIDRINFSTPPVPLTEIVIEGAITNAPGPYTVKLSNVIKSDATLPLGVPVNANRVFLADDAGTTEELTLVSAGVYQSSPSGIRGTIGRSYHVRVEMDNGNIFESVPDKMTPVGRIDSLYYEWEEIVRSDKADYGYRIYVDSHTVPGEEYLRWKFVGTYVVETLPQYSLCQSGACRPDGGGETPGNYCPLPCSGYMWVDGQLKMGYRLNPRTQEPEYVQGLECTCCRCWVTPREDKPKVNDGALSASGKFNKVEVGYVPINYYTFFERYRVEVYQMSLSRNSYEYWRAIQKQKEGIGSLFQPVGGRIPTNIFEVHGASSVQGIFYAAAVHKREVYLDKNTHKTFIETPEDCVNPPRKGAAGVSCLLGFPGSESTTVRPVDWKD